MPLYLVQDSDRPLYIVARSWSNALEQWTAVIAKENEGDRDFQPDGISRIAGDDELVIGGEVVGNVILETRATIERELSDETQDKKLAELRAELAEWARRRRMKHA